MSMTQEARQEVERFLRKGLKIQALKYLADTYGISLQESKLLVETLEAELQNHPAPISIAPIETNSSEGDDRKEIERLLRADKKLEAVKWVKSKYEIGLKEALNQVEVVEREINPQAQTMAKGCASNLTLLVGSIFSLVGFLLLGAGGIIYYADTDIIQEQNKTQGVVTDLQWNGSMAAPMITYTWQGNEYTYKSTSFTNPSAFEKNETVMLYVNPENPNEIVIDSFSERWLVIVILGGIGIIFAVLGLIFVFMSRRF